MMGLKAEMMTIEAAKRGLGQVVEDQVREVYSDSISEDY